MVTEIGWDDFLKLRMSVPLVDVRSQAEFDNGHIPEAFNIPLLNNAERVAVGTDYKLKGRSEAIKTGFRLVGPRLSQIIEQAEKVAVNKELIVHCWRGGMRSANFCRFAAMYDIHSYALKGGYKAYRQQALDSFRQPLQIILIAGCTGSGKSEVLRRLKLMGEQVLDLEAMASHKGSAFGGLMMPAQPTTEQFQNFLFEQILLLDVRKPVWVEDESIAIGKIFLPNDFWRVMRNSPVVILDVEKKVRIDRLVWEYGCANQQEFLAAMTKITKKLGGQHFNDAKHSLLANDLSSVMDILLTYYDKAYLGSLQKRNPVSIGTVVWDGVDAAVAAQQMVKIAREKILMGWK